VLCSVTVSFVVKFVPLPLACIGGGEHGVASACILYLSHDCYPPLSSESTVHISVFGYRGAFWLPLSRALWRAAWTAAVEGGGCEESDRRRFCPLAFSGYFLVTSRRHRRELCRQEVANGGYKESHSVDPRGHPSKRIASRFVRFQA